MLYLLGRCITQGRKAGMMAALGMLFIGLGLRLASRKI